jgi:hypothetical protein
MRSLGFVVLTLCLLGIRSPLQGQDSIAQISFFPSHKVFPLLTADGLAHQFSISRVTDNRDYIAAIGGAIPVVQLNIQGMEIQSTIAVTLFNRIIKTPGHITVYTIDYKVDVPFDFQFPEFTLRVAAGHISCHFADDGIELLGKRSLQHVNDYVTLQASRTLSILNGYVYGGLNYSYGTQPIQYKPWLFQFGMHFGNYPVHEEIVLYGAIDLKVREENGWGSTRSFQIGARFFPHSHVGARIAYTFRQGFEERGQFYLDRTTLNLLSLYFDF